MSDTPIIGAAPSKAAPANAAGAIFDTTTPTFMKDVIEASKSTPVLVDFWAPWCGPCRQLTPLLEKTVKAARGKIKLAKMNIDEHPEVAGQLGVQSIPAVFAFKDGRPIDGFMGAVPESQLKTFVERVVGPGAFAEEEDIIAVGNEALDNNDVETAIAVFSALLEEEPDNIDAIGGLARAHVADGNLDEAEATLARAPLAKQSAAAIAAARAKLELLRKAPKTSTTQLEEKLRSDPNDHDARFEYALALNSAGQRAAAADQLLEIMRRNRQWKDDGARQQLVEFFDAWGPKDPATLDGRRQLSLLLFS